MGVNDRRNRFTLSRTGTCYDARKRRNRRLELCVRHTTENHAMPGRRERKGAGHFAYNEDCVAQNDVKGKKTDICVVTIRQYR